MMLLLKKLVGLLIAPLTLATILALAAAVLALFRRRRTGCLLVCAAGLIVYFASAPAVGELLLGPLERQFAPLAEHDVPATVQYIVVLGSGYEPHDRVPVTAALDSDGLVRVVEGIRLYHRLSVSRLVLSGGASGGQARSADGYALLAHDLGVPDLEITRLREPRDTAEEARAVIALVGDAQFILVTSAYHMPRAVRLMKRAGGNPIPAPTGQMVSADGIGHARAWLPSYLGLQRTGYAVHEGAGLLAMSLAIE